MIDRRYRAQVDLLLRILPHVAEEEVFALKGGTAINLFIREMPRLSVDFQGAGDKPSPSGGITLSSCMVKAC
jgi:hypothetical protein